MLVAGQAVPVVGVACPRAGDAGRRLPRIRAERQVAGALEDRLERQDIRVFSAGESALAKQLKLEDNRGGGAQSAEESVLQHLLEGRFTDEALFELQAASAGWTI